MRSVRGVIAGALTLAVAAAAFAQPGTGFTITDGDVVFSQPNSPTSGTTTSVSGGNFRVNGPAGTDHLFENWWWFRGPNDTREFAFNSATGTVVAGNTATTTFSTALFNASLQYRAQDTGLNLGNVTETMVITNTTTSTLVLDLFNYVDYDVNASSGSDSATAISPTEIQIVDTVNPAWDLRYAGVGANAFQVTSFATLRGLLTNTAVNNLNNTGLPFSGDFTGGFQWTLEIPAGGSATVVERLAVVPEPASLGLLALGLMFVRRR